MGQYLKRLDRNTLLVPLLAGLITFGVLVAAASMNVGNRALGFMAIVALIWGAGFFWSINVSRRREHEQWLRMNRNVGELTSRTKSLFEFMARQFNGQFDNIQEENSQVRTLLADAIEKLINSFTGLEEQTRRQQDLALGLTKKRDDDTGVQQANIESFLAEIDEVLRSFADAITRNSELARNMVHSMGETSSQFQKVLGMLDEVKKIADQTNLLAINAAVEAARAGQAGKGFAVVAEEVRNLSIRSNRFSDQIGASVSGITQALSSVEEVIQQMATQDQTVSGNTKARVDGLMSKTRAFNEKIEESVGQISESSEHVGAEVRRAVTSLQFQDMATQVLGTMQGRVENLGSLLESLAVLSLEHRESGADLRDDCEKRLDEFKTALNEAEQLLERAGHNPVSQKSLDEGDIELF